MEPLYKKKDVIAAFRKDPAEATRVVPSLHTLTYKERLQKLKLSMLEVRRR